MVKKLVLIGAGSVSFTQGLIADLLRNTGEFKWHLSLVDIDPSALDTVTKLCRKMLDAKGSDIELSYSTDRCDVLPGADYVVTTIAVGGRRAWEQDVFIPRKYGIYQPVGDTAMPGGISRAMRMIPAMIDIVRDIMRLCPNALFFNYANPMTMNCRAVRKATGFPIVGLCHGVNNMEGYLAEFAGLDRKRLTAYSIGLNHLTFMYDVRYDGKDAMPLLKEKYQAEKEAGIDYSKAGLTWSEYEDAGIGLGDVVREPFAWEVFEAYNAFPAPGDRHISEFFTERFPGGMYYNKKLGIDAHSFEKTIVSGDVRYEKMIRLAQSPDPLPESYFGIFSGEHEQLIDIIHSIEKDSRKVYSVNLPNNGAVPNLPDYALLELPAAATGKGLLPLQINDFPDVLAGIIAKYSAIVELTVDAALKGDRNLYAEAILAGGYISDRNEVNKMVDELIKAHKDHLPQFK